MLAVRVLVGLAGCVFVTVGAGLLALGGGVEMVAGVYLVVLAIVALVVALDERGPVQ